jgi:uncharacterized protein YceK
MRSAAVGAAELILAGLTGCGTASNLSPPRKATQVVIPEQRFAVFGGVVNDVNQVKWVWQQPGVDGKVTAPFVALDIPLSVVGDALTLPVTAAAAFLPIEWFMYGDEPPPDTQILDRWRRFWFNDQSARADAPRTNAGGN